MDDITHKARVFEGKIFLLERELKHLAKRGGWLFPLFWRGVLFLFLSYFYLAYLRLKGVKHG